ncbi:MAG TPA: hypothetical protein VMU11_00155 [Verrucomicrobiae bacterium]|nr:hypothetical protein [Verrucomicrobiae bacterium]
MPRSFDEIYILMKQGAGCLVRQEVLDAFTRRAVLLEHDRASNVGRVVRASRDESPRIVFLRTVEDAANGVDGSVVCNTIMRFPKFGKQLVLSIGPESCHPFWFGLKAYAEWLRHREYAEGRGREAHRLYGEFIARAVDFRFDRALSRLAPRRATGPVGRETVFALEERLLEEVRGQFPDAASDAETVTRRHLTDVAIHFAARGALGLAGVA